MVNLLEHNYRTWCSLHRTAPSASPFKKVLRDALDESGVAEQRVMLVDTDGYVRSQTSVLHLRRAARKNPKHSCGTASGHTPPKGSALRFLHLSLIHI